ncbi:PhzF family phenazine biosynthesis protein [Amycolatopsis taiwanensis]|uniref:Phenazine antibiotic biosynthesis-like protein n=1 Tax=Amycolatopsis taiwanensis TaxID=342230 RepID=A0A9W6R7P6_9PSEU|nr:PhzF family phenazine biosynthesis protein [Amycolatopsis taiwanensis]GLY70333.1 phenazine antibiotic biosynthesis-like protein [Amycolatopsis taiwanensis]
MPTSPFVTIDVFTEQRFGGNPLAVFTDAVGIPEAALQPLAGELNLSETTFVLPPDDPAHAARVRIFNRTSEMDFAGHPMVGTAYVLADRAREGRLAFEVRAGVVDVELRHDSAGIVRGAAITAPRTLAVGDRHSVESIAACLRLDTTDVVTAQHEPIEASMGNAFVMTEVRADALSQASPDEAAFRSALATQPGAGRLAILAYARNGDDVRTRMFAPLSGTPEDPATGSANVALAGLLLNLSGGRHLAYTSVQGVEMGRESRMELVAWRESEGIRASVAGSCIPVLRGEAEFS